jgi:glycerol-3-phosphate dehydrogenase
LFGRVYDLAIIGGGITGAAIARDAAGRGLSVFLCEQGDLASGASSATGKIVHGNLRLLEGLQVGAMREAVAEREILMHAAPHLVRPLRFLIPHHEGQWSSRALRIGLFAYDRVARNSLPRSRRVPLEADSARGDLKTHFTLAFSYGDCVVDDSRLAVLNALDARGRGASVHTHVQCTVAERDGGRWRLLLESTLTGERSTVLAKMLVNAAGPSAGHVLNHVVQTRHRVEVTLTRSAHLLVERLGAQAPGYALTNADGRIVYAIPYGRNAMLLGSAEQAYRDDPGSATVDADDVAYLLDVTGQYFHEPVREDDIIGSFAAVSALPADASLIHRERAILVDAPPRQAPLISVFGGTLGTHRKFAEEAVDRLGRFRSLAHAWTAAAVLPGGGFPADGAGDLARALRAAYPFITERHAERLVGTYGTRASAMLLGARVAADLGERFGGDLTEAEVKFLRHEEWAMTADDILWRRSKLGLTFTDDETAALEDWMAERPVEAIPVS